jgi:branched-chain amino acid transport system permease protein
MPRCSHYERVYETGPPIWPTDPFDLIQAHRIIWTKNIVEGYTVKMTSVLRKNNLLYMTIFIILGLIPIFVRDPYFLHFLIMLFFYAYLGGAWNLLGGYAGQFSLGHAAFFGIGAYISTILYIHLGITPWLGMLIGAVFSTLVGIFLGFLCFRYGVRGVYFVLITLCSAEIVRLIFINWRLFGGPTGLLITLSGNSFAKFQFISKFPYYYIIFFMMLLMIAGTYLLENSKVGEFFIAIRENEDTAEASGINTTSYKLASMAMSCFAMSLGGTFYAQYMLYINPDVALGVGLSIEILFGPIAGGIGTILGPLVGSSVLMVFSEIARITLGQFRGMHLMLYGIFIIFIMMYMPQGVLGHLRTAYQKVSGYLE